MADKQKIKIVHFINAINIGGDVSHSVEAEKHKAELEKTSTGLWIRRLKYGDKWVPDANIRWFECE